MNNINIQELHYQFKIGVDKVDSLKTRNFLPAEIDWLLNEASLLYLRQEYSPPEGFEVTQRNTDNLSSLVIKSPSADQPAINAVPVIGNSGCYEAALDQLTYPYLFMIRMRARATKTGCGTKNIEVSVVQHDDLTTILRSPFEGPDYDWYRVPAVFAKKQGNFEESSVYLYTDGNFTIDALYPEYIKMPRKVFFGGYTSLDGQYTPSSPQVTLDFPEGIHRKIVDIAVQEARRDIGDPNFQLSLQKNSQND